MNEKAEIAEWLWRVAITILVTTGALGSIEFPMYYPAAIPVLVGICLAVAFMALLAVAP